MSGAMTLRAHAKINPYLRVLGRRPDGYHDIESVLLPVSLFDTVTVSVDGAPGLTLSLAGDPAQVAALDGSASGNLALVAARELARATGERPTAGGERPTAGGERPTAGEPSATIHINKAIPVGGGMAGGSADAAAVLGALNDLWGCGLDPAALAQVGARVGADVPAMLAHGPVHVHGRGDVIQPIYATPTPWVVKPLDYQIAAKDAYSWWDRDGSRTGPDGGAVLAAIETGATGSLGQSIFNDLEAGILARHPDVAKARDALLAAGAIAAIVSGSGPTVVGLAPHLINADKIAEQVPGSFVVTGPPK